MNISLQLERLTAGSIEQNANLIFDSTMILSGDSTGTITLLQAGRYQFAWWVAMHSSLSITGAGFVLLSSQGDIVIGNSSITTGEAVGIAVTEVAAAPVTVELRKIFR